jgi:hypothetical protein
MFSTDLVLRLAVTVPQFAVLVLLLRRKYYRTFPFFAAYIAYSISITPLRILGEAHHSYFLLYWITETISGVLELLALHEAFRPSLEMYYKLYRWSRFVPLAAVLGIVGRAAWRAFSHPLGPGWLGSFGAGAYAFEVGVRILEVGIFLLSLKLARRKDHPIGQQHPYGIVIGFGVAASTALLADFVGFKFGFRLGHIFETIFRYMPASGYIAAAAAWLITFATKERRRPRATPEEIQRRLDQQRNIAEKS